MTREVGRKNIDIIYGELDPTEMLEKLRKSGQVHNYLAKQFCGGYSAASLLGEAWMLRCPAQHHTDHLKHTLNLVTNSEPSSKEPSPALAALFAGNPELQIPEGALQGYRTEYGFTVNTVATNEYLSTIATRGAEACLHTAKNIINDAEICRGLQLLAKQAKTDSTAAKLWLDTRAEVLSIENTDVTRKTSDGKKYIVPTTGEQIHNESLLYDAMRVVKAARTGIVNNGEQILDGDNYFDIKTTTSPDKSAA